MAARPRRDIGPFLQMMRSYLFGRSWKTPHRFQEEMAPRPYPPMFPEPGPAEKLSANGYYIRDGRRRVTRPNVLVESGRAGRKMISDGAAAAAAEAGPQVQMTTTKSSFPPTPAPVYANK